jgi:general secretion pathway protein H
MNNDATGGFSLAEMLVALVVVSMALVVALSNPFAARHDLSVDLIARQVAAKLNSASARAVAGGKSVEAQIDLDSRRIFIERDILSLPEDMEIQLKTGLELLESKRKGSIVFLADGSASGGEIVLKAGDSQMRVIRVNWMTGSVRVFRGI